MNITEFWKNERIRYQQRYVWYLRRWNETHNENDKGHFLECSYVLINIFGLTVEQVDELEQNNYAGFTKKDLEDD